MSINFTARLTNLWRGFVSIWLSDIEKKNPEIAYSNTIRSMTAKHQQLKNATASLIARRTDLEDQLTRARKVLDKVNIQIEASMETGQDDLGVALLSKKDDVTRQITELEQSYQQALKDADSAKAQLSQLKAEVRRIEAEKDHMIARLSSAEARNQIREQLSGLSVDAEVQALNTVRQHVKQQEAKANLEDELFADDFDNRLDALEKQGSQATAQKRWAELKAQRQNAAQGEKTL